VPRFFSELKIHSSPLAHLLCAGPQGNARWSIRCGVAPKMRRMQGGGYFAIARAPRSSVDDSLGWPTTRPKLPCVGPCHAVCLPSQAVRDQAPAPVAQLDRALPSEGRGREFESRRVRHPKPRSCLAFSPWRRLANGPKWTKTPRAYREAHKMVWESCGKMFATRSRDAGPEAKTREHH
jgi:hypothetical protein